MSYLYAIIFEQGTVKVGMTNRDPEVRFDAHRSAGNRWGISPVKTTHMEVSYSSVLFKERVLREYCRLAADWGAGLEWFRYKSAEEAISSIDEIFKKIMRGEFCELPETNSNRDSLREAKFMAAMEFVKNGVPGNDAALMFGLQIQSVVNRTEYKKFMQSKEQGNA